MDYRDPTASVQAGEARRREEEREAAAERAELETSIAEVTTPPAVALGRVAWGFAGMVFFGLALIGSCVAMGSC